MAACVEELGMPLPEHLVELDRRYQVRLDRAVEALRSRFEERLRASSDELARALRAESAALPAAEPLDSAELARLEREPRRAGERSGFTALHEAMVAFDRADSQAALLEALLAAARRFVPRAGLLLTRAEGVVGWGGVGFDEAGDRLAGREIAWGGGALEALARGRGCIVARGADAEAVAERLALPAATEVALVPLVLRDAVAAALYADRRADEEELPLAALQLIVLGAAQRLELQALTQRTQTPTLFLDGDDVAAGLGLWSPRAATTPVTAAMVATLAPEAPAAAVGESAAAMAGERGVAAAERLESAGVEELFSLTPGLEAVPAGAVEAPPAPPPEPIADLSAYEPERVFEVEPEADVPFEAAPGLAPEAAGEPVFELELDMEPAAPVPLESAAEPGAVEVPALEPAGTGAIEFEAEPVAPLELGWEMEDAEATVFQPEAASAPVEGAREERTAPFELPAADTRDLPLPAGATWSVLAPADEVAAEAPPPGLETRALPIRPPAEPEPVEDATVRISRPAAAVPRVDTTEDATVLVPRRPGETPPAAALAEDATELVRRPPPPPSPPPTAPPSEATEEPIHPGMAARAAAEEEPGERTHARAARGTEVVPPPDLQGPGLAFTTGRIQRATGENALHEEARRLARLLISEIKLYNEEQVEEGRRHRDLYLRLKEDIDRSRQIYDERVHDSVRGSSDYFQQELVRSLAGGDPRALGI